MPNANGSIGLTNDAEGKTTFKHNEKIKIDMTKILANDGISETGIQILKENNFTIETKKVSQEDLIKSINIIIVITGTSSGYKEMKSWDKFRLPKPFGKIQLVISPPLKIREKPKTTSDEIHILSDFMNQYQNEADHLTGKIN